MNFLTALHRKVELEESLDRASKILHGFKRDGNGLILESLRVTDEYQQAKSSFQSSLKDLQES